MKFQILFLSLLTITHARYEPKGLRLRDRDDVQLSALATPIHIAPGQTATIRCDIGTVCCLSGTYKISGGFNSGHCDGRYNPVTVGEFTCLMGDCPAMCDSSCDVQIKGGDASHAPQPQPQPSPSRPIPIPPNRGGNTSAMKTTRVAEGDSATFQCRSGSQSCQVVKGSFDVNSQERNVYYSKGLLDHCNEKQCVISCDEGCKLDVQAGSVGGNVEDGDSGGKTSASGTEKTFHVPEGKSLTFQCDSGSQCCWEGQMREMHIMNNFNMGGKCSPSGSSMTGGAKITCGEKQCLISCDEDCKVNVQAGSVGGNVRARPSPPRRSATSATRIAGGQKATISCNTGLTCCMKGSFNFNNVINTGNGINCDGMTMTSGEATCTNSKRRGACTATCPGSCDVQVKARPSPPRRPRTPSHTPGISTKGGKETTVPKGGSVTLKCGSGGKCCVDGSWGGPTVLRGVRKFGGCEDGKNGWASLTDASLSKCSSKKCLISCDGDCEVNGSADYYMNEE